MLVRAPEHRSQRAHPSALECERRPVTYALQSPDYGGRESWDSLANYLSAGPKDPWVHPLLRIEAPKDTARPLAMPDSAALHVVLHGHFHYTGDLMRALAANAQPCQLILTTTSTNKAAEIRATLRESGAEADIRVVPNHGRDIAPFLMVLEPDFSFETQVATRH